MTLKDYEAIALNAVSTAEGHVKASVSLYAEEVKASLTAHKVLVLVAFAVGVIVGLIV